MRFSVDTNSNPPGCNSPARVRAKAAGSGTCSITSSAVTTGNRMPSRQQILRRAHPVGQAQVLAGGVPFRCGDRLGRGIQAQHVEASPGQRFRRQAGAAAYVQQADAGAVREHGPF